MIERKREIQAEGDNVPGCGRLVCSVLQFLELAKDQKTNSYCTLGGSEEEGS